MALLPVSAQKSFSEGKVFTLAGDTLSGYIEDKGDLMMCKVCSFTDEQGNIIEYLPADIAGYKLGDSKYYLSKRGFLEPVFMEVLVEGKLNLYYYRDAVKDHFFVQKEDAELLYLPFETVIERKENSKIYSKKTQKHIGILRFCMFDEPSMFSQIDQMVDLEYKDLIRLVEKYNALSNSTIYIKTLPPKTYYIEMLHKVNWMSTYEKMNNFHYEVGCHLSVWLPRSSEKLYFKTGLSFMPPHEIDEGVFIYNQWVFKMPLQFHYVLSKNKISPLIGGGFSMWFFDTKFKNVGGIVLPLNLGGGMRFNQDNGNILDLSLQVDQALGHHRYLIGGSKTAVSFGITYGFRQ